MDEAVQLALKHQRELHDDLKKDVEDLEESVDKKLAGIKTEIKSLKTWDRFKMVGFILVGLWLSSVPEYVPLLKNLLK